MFRPRRGVRGSRGSGLGIFLLMFQMMQVGFNHIPPTTLATIALNVAIYLKVLNPFFDLYLRPASIRAICVSSFSVWYKSDWPRLFYAGWFHLDDMHLYYNMASFMWKGRGLEGVFGSVYFAYVIMVFSVLTNAVMVGINIGAAELMDESYVSVCAAGFSGVIFALKVLATHYTPTHMQRIFGIPVPSAWACWIELVLIQLLVPNASFTGHLAGILVGLAYVKGPLKTFMDIIFNLNLYVPTGPTYTYSSGTAQGRPNNRQAADRQAGAAASERSRQAAAAGQRSRVNNTERFRSQPSYTYRSGTSGGDDESSRDEVGGRDGREGEASSSMAYAANDYTGGMSEEEQFEAAIRESTRGGSTTRNPPSSANDAAFSSPSLPPHPASTNPHQASTSAQNHRNIIQPPSFSTHSRAQPNEDYNDVDPTPPGYRTVNQDELRRRRLARFDR